MDTGHIIHCYNLIKENKTAAIVGVFGQVEDRGGAGTP